MLVIPAIDLWEGKVVRLLKGNPAESTVYNNDPVGIAKEFKLKGVELLHLVDLSAALGQDDNLEVIGKILKEVDIKVEVGGGIRDIGKAKKLISLGAERVIVGTKSLEDKFLKNLIRAVGVNKIAVSVDVIDSRVAVKGWQEKTSFQALDFIKSVIKKGIKWVIYTDISRDGTLEGLDLGPIKEFSLFKKANLIVSGGVSSIEDIKKIKEETPFVWGVITGKAIYERRIDLAEAILLSQE
ncbi:MAG: 1-(5-phosphoribosyl)-5-[(5-phosphoribosylamino)methylideneamino]imidazole-4-carboxamide isomerase [Candidatus Omnitrophica bacterium]|nr:1-(5-phosphoribosyl)-5-[(5-phosphoribosylamino)methylideneamino]imidazole-4-carboxamide isomerase [Candidatus Omnitrophota bacterium]